MRGAFSFHDYINAFFIFLDDGQSAAGSLQQRGQLGFRKAFLLLRIAHVPLWRAHVQRSADLTFEQHVVAPQMSLSRFARGLQLLQVSVAEFALLILLIADGLRVNDSLGNWRSRSRGLPCICF